MEGFKEDNSKLNGITLKWYATTDPDISVIHSSKIPYTGII